MALGILGHDASVFDLCALLLDEQAARQTLGGKAVPERMRAFAGLSLGLLGARTGTRTCGASPSTISCGNSAPRRALSRTRRLRACWRWV